MTDDQIRTQIRLPQDLHVRLVLASQMSRRSLNAEMIQRLESTFAENFEQVAVAALEGDLERAQQRIIDMRLFMEDKGEKMTALERGAAQRLLTRAEEEILRVTAEIEALKSGKVFSLGSDE